MDEAQKWFDDGKCDASAIISSRVRLARNFRKYPFYAKLDSGGSQMMVDEAVGYLNHYFPPSHFGRKKPAEKLAMVERHSASPEFLRVEKPKELLTQEDEKISVMINEEDHVRIQTISPGDGVEEALGVAYKIDDLIEENMEYAFDKNYGYLTSCPTNAGTGMRASFMIHLPMLERSGTLKNVVAAVTKFGYALRGIYGEGTDPMGDIYQLSNQMTLGKSEDEIIKGLRNVAGQLIDMENRLRERAFAERKAEIMDGVGRSYGILAYSRIISAPDAMRHLSDIRAGSMLGILPGRKPEMPIYRIMMGIQPGSLQLRAGKELDERERDMARSDMLREIFNGR